MSPSSLTSWHTTISQTLFKTTQVSTRQQNTQLLSHWGIPSVLILYKISQPKSTKAHTFLSVVWQPTHNFNQHHYNALWHLWLHTRTVDSKWWTTWSTWPPSTLPSPKAPSKSSFLSILVVITPSIPLFSTNRMATTALATSMTENTSWTSSTIPPPFHINYA